MTNIELRLLLSQYDDDAIVIFAGNPNTSFPEGPTTTGVTVLKVQAAKYVPDADRHGNVLNFRSEHKGAVDCVTLF